MSFNSPPCIPGKIRQGFACVSPPAIEVADFKAKHKLRALSCSYYISCISDHLRKEAADIFEGNMLGEEKREEE